MLHQKDVVMQTLKHPCKTGCFSLVILMAFREVAALNSLTIVVALMKRLVTTLVLIPGIIVVLSGCGSTGPSPEQQTREAQQQLDAERQQAEFRKSLPPVANPGRGQ